MHAPERKAWVNLSVGIEFRSWPIIVSLGALFVIHETVMFTPSDGKIWSWIGRMICIALAPHRTLADRKRPLLAWGNDGIIDIRPGERVRERRMMIMRQAAKNLRAQYSFSFFVKTRIRIAGASRSVTRTHTQTVADQLSSWSARVPFLWTNCLGMVL